jgi:hypothetical protein
MRQNSAWSRFLEVFLGSIQKCAEARRIVM